MIKAVIFDLDDTLISEREYIESGFRHISKILRNHFGVDNKEIYQLLVKLFNESPVKVFNRLFDELKINYDNDVIKWLVNEYRNHEPKINFYDDVLPALEKLKSKNIKTGIITDGYAITQKQKIHALNAEKLFDEIIITDELGGKKFWKPNPKAFEIMSNKLNVAFEEMVYVGDNPEKDFYISRIIPVKTIRIYRDGIYKNKHYLENVKENCSIKSLKELIL